MLNWMRVKSLLLLLFQYVRTQAQVEPQTVLSQLTVHTDERAYILRAIFDSERSTANNPRLLCLLVFIRHDVIA